MLTRTFFIAFSWVKVSDLRSSMGAMLSQQLHHLRFFPFSALFSAVSPLLSLHRYWRLVQKHLHNTSPRPSWSQNECCFAARAFWFHIGALISQQLHNLGVCRLHRSAPFRPALSLASMFAPCPIGASQLRYCSGWPRASALCSRRIPWPQCWRPSPASSLQCQYCP